MWAKSGGKGPPLHLAWSLCVRRFDLPWLPETEKKSGYCLLFSQQAHISTAALPPVPRRLPPLPPPHLCRLPLHHPHWSHPSSQGPQSHDFFKESCSNLFLRPLGVLALRIKLPSTTCRRALQVNISVTNLSHTFFIYCSGVVAILVALLLLEQISRKCRKRIIALRLLSIFYWKKVNLSFSSVCAIPVISFLPACLFEVLLN